MRLWSSDLKVGLPPAYFQINFRKLFGIITVSACATWTSSYVCV
jgi:hypothetical protein